MKRNTHLLKIIVVFLILYVAGCKDNPIDVEQQKLGAPISVQAEVLLKMKIHLKWTNTSTGKYETMVERRTGMYGTWSMFAAAMAGENEFIDSTRLTPDSSISYRMRAYANGVFSEFSSIVSVSISLPPPTNLRLVSNSESAIAIQWNDNSNNEAGFYIERSDGGPLWTLLATLDSNAVSYADTSFLLSTVNYNYRVTPFIVASENSIIRGGSSNVLGVQPTTYPAPSNLAVVAYPDSGVSLAWKDNTDSEIKFFIERKTTGPYLLLDSAAANIVSYFDKSAISGDSLYFYRVEAKSARRMSDYSNMDTCRTPLAPSALSATSIAEKGISLSWSDNALTESGFQVERQAPSASGFSLFASLPPNTTSFVDTAGKMVDGESYSYRVRALSKKGNVSTYTNTATSGFSFPSPSQLGLTHQTKGSFKLTWKSNSAFEDGYFLEILNVSTNRKDTIRLAAGITQYVYNADYHYSYTARVKSYRRFSESNYSTQLGAELTAIDITNTTNLIGSAEFFAVALDSTGSMIVTGEKNGIVRIWSRTTGVVLQTLTPDTLTSLYGVVINPQNTCVAAVYDDGSIRVWNISDGSISRKISTGLSGSAIAWAPDGNSIVTGHANGGMKIWDIATGNIRRALTGHSGAIRSVRYSLDGTLLLSGSSDQSIKVWNVASGSEMKTFTAAHSGLVNGVCFVGASDTLFASVGSDGVIKSWLTSSNTGLSTIGSHLSSATSVVGPTNDNIVSSGDDGYIKLWRLLDGRLLKSSAAHTNAITSSAYSSDVSTFAAASKDKSISIWNLSLAWVSY